METPEGRADVRALPHVPKLGAEFGFGNDFNTRRFRFTDGLLPGFPVFNVERAPFEALCQLAHRLIAAGAHLPDDRPRPVLDGDRRRRGAIEQLAQRVVVADVQDPQHARNPTGSTPCRQAPPRRTLVDIKTSDDMVPPPQNPQELTPMADFLFTSESVTEGHPDKLCDAVSDSVLDAILTQDKHARVACETATKTGFVLIAGEITTKATIDYPRVVRAAVKEIGYAGSEMGFDWESCGVLVAVEQQSPDIAQGVDGKGIEKGEQGAGDQGMMFGYACDDTPEKMPMPIALAHRLTRRLAAVRKKGVLPFVRPDGKSQVSVRYVDDKPVAVDTVVVSTQHSPDVKYASLREAIIDEVIKKEIPAHLLHKDVKYFVNPTGRFVVGGPMGDSGLTGRKIIVDTYGGWGRHGGGAFSGKDPSKVDRSAAYYARYIAKNIVAAGLARRCEVQLAYAIGVAQPVSVLVTTFGTGTVTEADLSKVVRALFDARPAKIIEQLDLLRPIYRQTAAYGHFGRNEKDFTWEKTDRVDELRAAFNKAAAPASKKNRSAGVSAPVWEAAATRQSRNSPNSESNSALSPSAASTVGSVSTSSKLSCNLGVSGMAFGTS